MIASSNDILSYIPQRPPMVMVDSLIESSETSIVSRFTLLSSNIFIEGNTLNEAGIIENIAQTAAAGVGYKQVINNLPIKLGYIAAIKNLQINFLPEINAQLETTVNIVNEVIGITIVFGAVSVNGKRVAECEMRIFTNT